MSSHPVLRAASGGRASVDKGMVVVTALVRINVEMVDQNIFVADQPYRVVSVEAAWAVADTGIAEMEVRRCTGTTPPGSGSHIIKTMFDLTGPANTVVNVGLSVVEATRSLAEGDRIALAFPNGIPSAGLEGLCVTLVLIPKSAGGDDTGNKRYWLSAA